MYPSTAVGTDEFPVYTTPSQDSKAFKASHFSDTESQTESPSTIAPESARARDSQTDSHGNSSDSDAPPVRRGFTSEDSPDGSSDSDVPASTESDHLESPYVRSITPPSSDELTSSDEAPIDARMLLLGPAKPKPQHPLAVIGWTGHLPCHGPEAEPSMPHAEPSQANHVNPDGLTECDCTMPAKPDIHTARNCAQSAKRLTKALETELRDLEDEMSSLTEDLIAIKRTIPSRTPEGKLVFSGKHC
jgi:hypothetical protein